MASVEPFFKHILAFLPLSFNLVKCNLTKLTTTSLAVKRFTSVAVKQFTSIVIGKGMKGWIEKGARIIRGRGKTKITAKLRDRSIISNKSFSHS